MWKINFWFWYSHHLAWYVCRFLWRIRVYGESNIPKSGPVIIAGNHLSLGDPPIIGSAIRRETSYLAKQELFEIPVFGTYLRKINAFPIKRAEQDVSALRTAHHILNRGKVLVMFPEGTRSRTGELGKGKPGVGMLACITGAAVVPTYIKNSNRLFRFLPLEVRFGPVLRFMKQSRADKEYYQQVTDRIMAAINELKQTS